jgi:SAM-dependent methyltransferase
VKQFLEAPAIYQLFQNLGGFFGARVKCIDDYLSLKAGDRIIDIGCGPGYIVNHLPREIHYLGFDTDSRYIAHARKHFGNQGSFFCQPFDEASAQVHGPVDVAMMNGLIHHLDDGTATQLLQAVRKALKPAGVLFTLDGCFREGQSMIAKKLLENDRGKHIRTEQAYGDLYRSSFEDVTLHIREDVSRLPYTFVVGLLRPKSISSNPGNAPFSGPDAARAGELL